MEDRWIGCEKSVNGVDVKWYEGDPYIDLKEYKKLLKELEDLKNGLDREEK